MHILFIADPLEQFKIYKDTTFSMMREAQRRGHKLSACLSQDLTWQRGHPVIAKNLPYSGDEAIHVRYVSKNVVGMYHGGCDAHCSQVTGDGQPEELCNRGNRALGDRNASHVPGGFDSEHSDAATLVVLKQIAVVARGLDDQARAVEPPLLAHGFGEVLGMLQHRV